jgi:hypothetical protein
VLIHNQPKRYLELLMCASISVLVSAMIGLTGIIDVALQLTKPLDHSAWQYSKQSNIDSVDAIWRGFEQARPIEDPDNGSGRSFEQDKPPSLLTEDW